MLTTAKGKGNKITAQFLSTAISSTPQIISSSFLQRKLLQREHGFKRYDLFSKINSAKNIYKKKTLPKDIGEAIADIIEPITNNIECLEGIKTESDFKKGFFRSLCGDKLPQSEVNPAAFFARHPELSIRKEALQDIDIRNMVGLFEDATKPEIKTAFINRFSKTVQDSAGKDIPQGELLTRYITEIDHAVKERNEREVKFDSRRNASPEDRRIAEAFKILEQKRDNANLTTTELNNSFQTFKTSFQTVSERDKIKRDLEKLQANSNISHLTIENLIKHINGMGLQYDALSQDNKNILKDFGTLNTEITQTLKKIEDDIIKLQTKNKTSPPNISSASYQNELRTAQKENQDLITKYQNNATQYTEILTFYNSFRGLRQAQYNLDKSPENKRTLDIIDGTIANINTFLLNVPKIIVELEAKQKEFQELLIHLSPEDMAEVNRLVTEARSTLDAISVSASHDEGSRSSYSSAREEISPSVSASDDEGYRSSSSSAREEISPQNSPSFKATPPQALAQIFPQEVSSFKAKPPQTLFTSQLNTQLYNFRKILQKNLKGLSPKDKKYPILQECLQDINSAEEQTRNDFPQDTLILKEKAQKFEASLSRFTRLLDYAHNF